MTTVSSRTFSNIQIRRGTGADWTSKNPILLAGEFGLDTSNGGIKIGNGVEGWNSLSYFAGSGGSEVNASTTNAGIVELATANETLAGTSGGLAVTPASLVGFLPAGMVSPFAGSSAPFGWLFADGAAVSRTVFSSLFLTVGVQYGPGDGTTTFNVPDMRGRVPAGRDAGQAEFLLLGGAAGEKAVTLSIPQMPSHTHTQNSHNHTQNAHTHAPPVTVTLNGNAGADRRIFTTNSSLWSAGDDYNKVTSTTATNNPATATNQNTGGGTAHNNLQPYRTLNYIIKT